MALDAGQGLVGIVVSLLDEAQLLSLLLVEADGGGVALLEALEGEDQELAGCECGVGGGVRVIKSTKAFS